MAKRPYICYACRDNKCFLCATDSDPKKPCMCGKTQHVETEKGYVRKYIAGKWNRL